MQDDNNDFAKLPVEMQEKVYSQFDGDKERFSMASACKILNATLNPNYLLNRLITKYNLNRNLFALVKSEFSGTDFKILYNAIVKIQLYHIAPLNNKFQILFLSGNSDLIRQKLDESPKLLLDWKDCHKGNLLHYLALSGNIEDFKFVLEKYPSQFNKENCLGRNPLHYFGLSGNLDAIKYGLKNHSELNKHWGIVTDKEGRNLLHFTLLSGNVTAIEYVLQNYPELNQSFLGTFGTDKKGRNSLHYAGWSGNIETIEFILKKFPTLIGKKDNAGRNLLHYVVMSKNIVAIKHIFEDELTGLLKPNKNWQDQSGANPLHYAVTTCDVAIIGYFLKNYHVLDVVDGKNRGLLHYAVETNDRTIVNFLFDNSKNLKVNAKCDRGETPLYIAANNGFLTMTKLLLSKPNIDVNSGITKDHGCDFRSTKLTYGLFLASCAENTELKKYNGKAPALIKQGEQYYILYQIYHQSSDKPLYAKLTTTDELNELFLNPLPEKIVMSNSAYPSTYYEIYENKFYRPENFQMRAPYDFNFGPLCAAVKEGHLEIIKLLLTVPNIDRKDALYIAAKLRKEKFIELLLNAYPMNKDLSEVKHVRGYLELLGGKIENMLDQPLKVANCIKEAGSINIQDPINIQLSKIFWSYAHSSFLSFNYRDSHLKTIAEKISFRLTQENTWDFSNCLEYIEDQIGEINESTNSLGTFRGLINLLEKIKNMGPDSQNDFIATINRK